MKPLFQAEWRHTGDITFFTFDTERTFQDFVKYCRKHDLEFDSLVGHNNDGFIKAHSRIPKDDLEIVRNFTESREGVYEA